jgi:hypothetical protein
MLLDSRVINWKKDLDVSSWGQKRSCPSICLGWLMKITIKLIQNSWYPSWDFNWSLPKYKCEALSQDQPFHWAKYYLVKPTLRMDRNNFTFEPVIIKIWLVYCLLHRLYYNDKLLIYILNNYLGGNWKWLWYVFRYCLGIYLDELGKKVINAGQKNHCQYL